MALVLLAKSFNLFIPCSILLVFFIFYGEASEIASPPKVSALFVFGDSTVDAGNNDYIVTPTKGDHVPYGRDFTDHKPTGRFSNGKLATDFLSAALGLKETLPAYLDPALTSQDLITGVCFASAGSGFDNATAEGSAALTLWKQVQYFKSYKTALGKVVGDQNASAIITNALFVCGTGVNDFMPNRRPLMRLDSYQDFLLQVVDNFIQELYSEGARRIAFMALPPMGCVPLVRTLALKQSPGKTVDEHGCLEDENQVAIDFNAKLKSKLAALQSLRSDLKLIYLDMYSVSLDIIHNPKNYGLDITARGCCGTGLTELGPLCNQGSLTCPDASKYVFWDASHPTQKGYEILTQLVLIPGLA